MNKIRIKNSCHQRPPPNFNFLKIFKGKRGYSYTPRLSFDIHVPDINSVPGSELFYLQLDQAPSFEYEGTRNIPLFLPFFFFTLKIKKRNFREKKI